MLKIEPIEEVITKRKLIVEIDEDEIAKILVDARPFQKQLRQERAKWSSGHGAFSLNGHQPHRKRAVKKASEKKSGRVRGVRCPKCYRVFKRLGRHVQTCTGQVDPLVAAGRSPLDE